MIRPDSNLLRSLNQNNPINSIRYGPQVPVQDSRTLELLKLVELAPHRPSGKLKPISPGHQIREAHPGQGHRKTATEVRQTPLVTIGHCNGSQTRDSTFSRLGLKDTTRYRSRGSRCRCVAHRFCQGTVPVTQSGRLASREQGRSQCEEFLQVRSSAEFPTLCQSMVEPAQDVRPIVAKATAYSPIRFLCL